MLVNASFQDSAARERQGLSGSVSRAMRGKDLKHRAVVSFFVALSLLAIAAAVETLATFLPR